MLGLGDFCGWRVGAHAGEHDFGRGYIGEDVVIRACFEGIGAHRLHLDKAESGDAAVGEQTTPHDLRGFYGMLTRCCVDNQRALRTDCEDAVHRDSNSTGADIDGDAAGKNGLDEFD